MYRVKQADFKSRIISSSVSGFTLIELLTVISIIAVLAAVTFGVSSAVKDTQARARAQAEIAILAQSLEQFKAKNGDYPWTSSGYSSSSNSVASNNGEELLQALTGWREFVSGNNRAFELKSAADLPESGFKSYLDIGKMTYVNTSNLGSDGSIEEYNPEVDLNNSAPLELAFLDPWGNPYIYVYNKSSNAWDNFGYVLYSKGPDGKEVTPSTNGVITDDIRNESVNADNIYAGE